MPSGCIELYGSALKYYSGFSVVSPHTEDGRNCANLSLIGRSGDPAASILYSFGLAIQLKGAGSRKCVMLPMSMVRNECRTPAIGGSG